ncbi:MAG TPA: nuclear transport factor 2 family protein [Chitinophagaceae bacterium]|nr:nuclear transport factor 2 family protein [Chitinophagaceae bacterium]
MKKLLILLLCSVISCSLYAQTKDEQAVAERMQCLHDALLKPDSSVLAGLADDNLTYGHSKGLIEDKKAFIEDLLTGKTVFHTLTFTEQTIKITGNNALVRNRFIGEVTSNNTLKQVDLIVLLVWRKQKGEWKLLARQAAKIPPAN